MSALARATCAACGKNVAMRNGGEFREHRLDGGKVCWASGSTVGEILVLAVERRERDARVKELRAAGIPITRPRTDEEAAELAREFPSHVMLVGAGARARVGEDSSSEARKPVARTGRPREFKEDRKHLVARVSPELEERCKAAHARSELPSFNAWFCQVLLEACERSEKKAQA